MSLDEFDTVEWRDIAQLAKPDLTDEEFQTMMDGYFKLKKDKSLQ